MARAMHSGHAAHAALSIHAPCPLPGTPAAIGAIHAKPAGGEYSEYAEYYVFRRWGGGRPWALAGWAGDRSMRGCGPWPRRHRAGRHEEIAGCISRRPKRGDDGYGLN